MSLRDKQSEFVSMVGKLIVFATNLGYDLSFGDGYIPFHLCPYCNKKVSPHMVNSNHYIRLALDLNAFKDGEYLRNPKDYKPLGLFWESLGGNWGGRFKESSPGEGDGVDSNHFSLEHDGIR